MNKIIYVLIFPEEEEESHPDDLDPEATSSGGPLDSGGPTCADGNPLDYDTEVFVMDRTTMTRPYRVFHYTPKKVVYGQ